ncbi:MAG: hypothetical protein L0Y66_16425, partial [Myxococcaceae bacterium]|nr:hypothetical protein [Myxococcaceae bacterium]
MPATDTRHISPIDAEALRRQVRQAQPFPHCIIDNFLEEGFSQRVLGAFPSYEDAMKVGRSFSAVNEQRKVQVTDAALFPEPIAELNRVLASEDFLQLLGHAFDIPHLLADP